MPGAIIHLEIARQTAIALNRHDLCGDNPQLTTCFMQGALAPDLGAFPGCDAFLSDLTHYAYSGTLASTLLRLSETPQAEAFALGWLTHYWGDLIIHPIINREVARLHHPKRKEPISWEDDQINHVRVEVALDGDYFFHQRLDVQQYLTEPSVLLRAEISDLMVAAWKQVYQLPATAEHFSGSHAQALQMNKILCDFSLIHGARHNRATLPKSVAKTSYLLFAFAKGMELLLGKRSPYFNISAAEKTSPQLLELVDLGVAQAVAQVVRYLEGPTQELPNVNLDSGMLDSQGLSRRARNTNIKLTQLRQGSALDG